MEVEIIIKLFSPFLHFWEKAVCFKGVSLDQRRDGRGGAGKGRRKKGKGVRKGERERKSGDRMEGDNLL